GDALEFIKTLENDSVDLILTDPPYLYNLSKRENDL
ncbi:DNA methylase, partial [Spiroplasma sp. ChiS]